MDSRRDPRGLYAGLATTVACLIVAACLVRLHDYSHLNADAAQYLSTSVNLVAGDGLTSDIVHWDQQYWLQSLPPPQTVFPPGMALGLTPLIWFGVPPSQAPFLIALMAYLGGAALIFALLRWMQTGPGLSVLGALLWLTLGYAWGNILLGLSEMLFTVATLGAMACCVRYRHRRAALVGAGACATMAVLVRYQGVFFALALLVWFTISMRHQLRGDIRRFVLDSLILLGLPLATFAILAFRNFVLTGTPGGGPVDTVEQGVAGLQFLREAYWAASSLTGFTIARLREGAVAEMLFVGASAGILVCWLRLRGERSTVSAQDKTCQNNGWPELVRLSWVYLLVSAALLCYLAATRSPLYLQGRFLVPLLPFAILAWIPFLSRVLHRSAVGWRIMAIVSVAAFHLAVTIAQGSVLAGILDELRGQTRLRVIHEAMAEELHGTTLGAFLASETSRNHPLIADFGQYVWLELEKPILSLTPGNFSAQVWDEAALRALQARYGAKHLLFFPGLFRPDAPVNANKPILQQLHAGHRPAFLRPIHIGQRAALYALDFDNTMALPPDAVSSPRLDATQDLGLDAVRPPREDPQDD